MADNSTTTTAPVEQTPQPVPLNSDRLSFDWRYADEMLVAGRQMLIDDGARFVFDMGGLINEEDAAQCCIKTDAEIYSLWISAGAPMEELPYFEGSEAL